MISVKGFWRRAWATPAAIPILSLGVSMNRNQRSLFIALVSILLTLTMGFAEGQKPSTKAENVLGRPRNVRLDYQFSLLTLPSSAKKITAWIPVPHTNGHQTLNRTSVAGGLVFRKTREPEYGNEFMEINLPDISDGKREMVVTVSFWITRLPCRALEFSSGRDSEEPNLSRFLQPDQLIPIDGKIGSEARRITQHEHTPFAKARTLYNHIVDTVRYDKSGSGWGLGDALYACTHRKGNCTDFHSLFIGEARALNIPARFVMGIPLSPGKTSGETAGYHCWAEFYVYEHGWVPIDASEAHQFPHKRKAFFGGLDANRVTFSIGRDIQIPGMQSTILNYVIHPFVMIDGKVFDKVRTRFFFEDLDIGT